MRSYGANAHVAVAGSREIVIYKRSLSVFETISAIFPSIAQCCNPGAIHSLDRTTIRRYIYTIIPCYYPLFGST